MGSAGRHDVSMHMAVLRVSHVSSLLEVDEVLTLLDAQHADDVHLPMQGGGSV